MAATFREFLKQASPGILSGNSHRTVNPETTTSCQCERAQDSTPGRTVGILRRRPKPVVPKTVEYEDECADLQEKTAGQYAQPAPAVDPRPRPGDRTVNTWARPKDAEPLAHSTQIVTESPVQRTPALPDPNEPEEELIRIASAGEVDALFGAMAEQEALLPVPGLGKLAFQRLCQNDAGIVLTLREKGLLR